MIFIFDIGFVLLFAVIALGSIAAILDWILDHILLFYFIVALKSTIMFGWPLLKKDRSLSVNASSIVLIFVDAARSSLMLYYLASKIAVLFDNGLFGLIINLINLFFFGGILIVLGEVPIAPLLDESEFKSVRDAWFAIAMEAVAIVAMFLFALWAL